MKVLDVQKLEVKYDNKQVVYGVSLCVNKKEIVSLIGHNGAGKTTTLKGIFGMIKILGGCIGFNGKDITHWSVPEKVKEGLSFVQQENAIFSSLSVLENLELGAYLGEELDFKKNMEEVCRIFPILQARQKQLSGNLSGGEQKQLAMGMALLMKPRLLMLDEPSLGLSPLLVKEVGKALKNVQRSGIAILLVEQNIKMVFSLTERIYIMKMGQIIHEDTKEKLSEKGQLWDLF